MRRLLLALLLVSVPSVAHAAIAQVGGGTQRATCHAPGVASQACAFPAAVTSGNLLVASGAIWKSGVSGDNASVSDTVGTTYTVKECASDVSWASGKARCFIAYGKAAASGANTITVAPAGGGTADISYHIDEFSGQNATTPLDVVGAGSSGSSAAPSDSVTTGVANALVVNVVAVGAGLTSATPSQTLIGSALSAGDQPSAAQFQLATTAGAYASTWSLSSSAAWAALSVSFAPAGSGGGGTGGGTGTSFTFQPYFDSVWASQQGNLDWYSDNPGGNSCENVYTFSYAMDAMIGMYEGTKDSKYVAQFLTWAEHLEAQHTIVDSNGKTNWPGTDGQWGATPVCIQLYEFQGTAPISRGVRIILADATLTDSYHTRATALYNWLKSEVVDKWYGRSGAVANLKASSADMTQGLDDKPVFFARLALNLHRISANATYLADATTIINNFHARFTSWAGGTASIYDYGLGNSIGSPGYQLYAIAPDTSHANRPPFLASEAYEAGIAFTLAELQKFGRLLTGTIWNQSTTSPLFHSYIDGTDISGGYCFNQNCTVGSNGFIAGGWCILALYDTPTYTLCGQTAQALVNGVSNASLNYMNTLWGQMELAAFVTRATVPAPTGTATKLVFSVSPGTVPAGGGTITPAVQVQATDANGNLIMADPQHTVTVALGVSGGCTLGGTATRDTIAGVATFDSLTVTGCVNSGLTLTASATGLTSGTSSTFTVAALPHLAFTVSPQSVIAGGAITPSIVVTVLDQNGATVTADPQRAVTLAWGTSGGLTLGGTLTQTTVAGAATFADITVTGGTGSGLTLVASAANASAATSATFVVTSPPANHLAFTTSPTTMQAGGGVITPAVVVKRLDSSGNVAAGDPQTSITIAWGNSNGLTLGGTLTVNTVAGVATFSSLNVSGGSGSSLTLKASATGFSDVYSAVFSVPSTTVPDQQTTPTTVTRPSVTTRPPVQDRPPARDRPRGR